MRRIDLQEWNGFGGGSSSKSYYHKTDTSLMLKMMDKSASTDMYRKEIENSEKVYNLGIPTPKPGELVTDGTCIGIIYERIVGKRSFARAIGEEPEKIPFFAAGYAEMVRSLHSTECPVTLFPDVKSLYRELILRNPYRSADLKSKAVAFMDSLPDATTCLHGDLHFGNIITTGRNSYFIDLNNFCYGNPLFDFGMMQALVAVGPDTVERFTDEFHCTPEQASTFYDMSLYEYFGHDTDLEKLKSDIMPYAAVRLMTMEPECSTQAPDNIADEMYSIFLR